RRAGLAVPHDISVVGYDDSRLPRLSHADLTTVAQDAEQMTTLAVTRAIDRLNGTPVTHRELVIRPRLVVRGTTAAARAAPDRTNKPFDVGHAFEEEQDGSTG